MGKIGNKNWNAKFCEIKMTSLLFHIKLSTEILTPALFFLPPFLLFPALSHLAHYSIACVKRVIAQIIQRQLSVFDTGEHNHHHKQPLMALSGSSKNAPKLGLAYHSAAGPNAMGTTALQPGPNFTLMNLDLARLLQKAAMAIQYPPRWSEATPMATVRAREPGAMWTWKEREGWGVLWLFLSLALVCSAQPFIPAHIQIHTHTHTHTHSGLQTDSDIATFTYTHACYTHNFMCPGSWLRDHLNTSKHLL